MIQERQMSETYRIGVILAMVGGYLDAYTYLCRGRVFANAQTGNIVLLGINLAEGQWRTASYYLLPILAFVAGIFVAEGIRSRRGRGEALHWRQIVVAVQLAALLGAAFLPAGKWDPLVNIIVSFVCSMQVETFRKVNGITCATTMCTGNLRSGTELLFRFRRSGDMQARKDALQYYGIILFFIVGAAAGTLITGMAGERSALVCCAALLLVFLLMHRWKRDGV